MLNINTEDDVIEFPSLINSLMLVCLIDRLDLLANQHFQYFLIVFSLAVLLLICFIENSSVENNNVEISFIKNYNYFNNAICFKYKSFCNYLNIKRLDKFRYNKSKIKAQNKKVNKKPDEETDEETNEDEDEDRKKIFKKEGLKTLFFFIF